MVFKSKAKFIFFILFNILIVFSLPESIAQSNVMLDESNIRLLHHIPNSEYIDIDLSTNGRYLVSLNSIYSGAGYVESNPNIPNEQYEATYLEVWDLIELEQQDISSNYLLPFERFLPPDFSKKIHMRQSGFSRPSSMNISISSNEEIIAVGVDDEISLYELESLNLITTMHQHNRRFLEWSVDENSLAYIADNVLNVWDVVTNEILQFELPATMIFSSIHPVTDGWIIKGYRQADIVLIICNDIVIECRQIEYNSDAYDLFPIMYLDGTIEIADYTETNEILSFDFTHLSAYAHSPSNRYIERIVSGEYGIWDIQNQVFTQYFEQSQTIAWLRNSSNFISVGSPDVITSVSLHEIGVNEPIQAFQLRNVIHEDWDFLTNYLTSVTASMANNATIFVPPDNTFVLINFTWVIIYIPLEN